MCFSLLCLAISVCLIGYVCGPPFTCSDGYQMKDGTCKKCDNGTFRNGNMPACQPLKTCDERWHEVAFPGNSTHNVVCRCTDPVFPILLVDGCGRDPNCPIGQYFSKGFCEACPNGTWKNETGPDECFNCTQCIVTSHECNATMDAKCVDSVDVSPKPISDDNSLPAGAIAGIVLVGVFLIFVIILFWYICWRKNRSGSSRWSRIRWSRLSSGVPSQNGDRNRSNANPNSHDPSTDYLNGSGQDENDDADNADGNNETSGQPSNGGESIPVDTSVVDNPSLPPVLPQPDPVAVLQQNQNVAPNKLRANEDPVNQNLNANQSLGGSQKNGSINPQNGGVVDPQVVVNPRTPSASFQFNPAHGNEEEQAPSLCSYLHPNDGSGRDTSVAGVAETPAAPSLDPTSQGIVCLREDPSVVSRTPSLPSQVPSLPTQVPSLPTQVPSQVPGSTETPLWDFEDCITKNYNTIYYHLTSLDYIWGALLEKDILTHVQLLQLKEIENNRSRHAAIDEMIRLMRLQGNNGFVCFIQALVAKETKLDELARRIHSQLAEQFIKKRDSELEDPEDQKSKIEPPRKASSGNKEGIDDIDFGKPPGSSSETKVKTIDSGNTPIKS